MIKKDETFTIEQNDIQLSNVFVKNFVNNSNDHGFQGNTIQRGNFPPVSNTPFGRFGMEERNVICIAVDLLPEEQIDYCRKQADLGKRVYLLLGNKEKNYAAIERLAGKCLIRTGVLQYGALLLQDGNSSNAKGWVYPTDIMADATKVETKREATTSLYQTFCYLFWKKATHEFFSQNIPPKELNPNNNPVMEIPIDEPYARPEKMFESLREDISRESDLVDIVSDMKNCGWISEVLSSENQCRKLILTIKNEEKQLPDVDNICKKAMDVSISENNELGRHNLICGRKIFYLPKYVDNEGVNWISFEKSDDRGRDIISSLPLHWKLNKTCVIGDLKAGDKIRFANQPSYSYEVGAKKEDNLGVVYADTIDNFLTKSPEQLCRERNLLQFSRDKLAHEIKYNVEIRPPVLPSGAKRDEIEILWEKVQNEWEDRLRKLEKDIAENEENKSKWGSQVRQHLSHFIVGQEQKIGEYRNQIAALKSVQLGKASRGEREQKWEEYLSLQRNVAALVKKTKAEKELADEVKKWETEREKLSKKIADYKEKISKETDKKKQKNLEQETEKIKENLKIHQMNRPKSVSECPSEQFGKVLGLSANEHPTKLSYPSEDLPLSGASLYRDGNMRYLVITTLDNLGQDTKDAQLLKAKICVKGE